MFSALPALACEGYNNALGALEDAIKQSSQTTKTSRGAPPMASINAAIDDLEEAIAAHNRAKTTQDSTQQKPKL